MFLDNPNALPDGRYPQSDTAAPKVRQCGTQTPSLRVAKSVSAGTPQQKIPRGRPIVQPAGCGFF
jgi:hypothetical protein